MFPTTTSIRSSALRRLRRARLYRALAATLLIGGFASTSASAATIMVISPDDTDTGAAGTCTLRQAVVSMNTGTLKGNCTNSGGASGNNDLLLFAASSISGGATPGTITLADSADTSGMAGGTLVVTTTQLAIDGSTWRGNGAGQYPGGVTIARATNSTQSFGILRDAAASGASLMLKGLTIHNGRALSGLCGGLAAGGGVCAADADLALVDSTISGNEAGYTGGGIAALTGTLALTRVEITSNTSYRGSGVYSGSGSATVTDSTLSANYNWEVGRGGAILVHGTLTMTRSTISGNSAKRGGGVYVDPAGTLAMIDCTVSQNSVYYDGGGIFSYGDVILSGSAIHDNNARYEGGGVHASGSLTASNSTISDNHSNRAGAGIHADGAIALDHVTLTRNSNSNSGGAIAGSGHGTIDRSIVAGNTQSVGGDIDLGGPWTGAYNLTTAAGLALGPLQDNGGLTLTSLPAVGSTAIDAIPLQDCDKPVDQRGVARPQGIGCDIGAVEVQVDSIFADGFERPST